MAARNGLPGFEQRSQAVSIARCFDLIIDSAQAALSSP
jgi:hypothetical protein